MTEVNHTSSLGGSWPPQSFTHQRLRGFYDRAVRNAEDVHCFADAFEEARQATQRHPTIGRLSARAVIRGSLLRQVEAQGVPVEAALPLAGHGDMVIGYFGWNKAQREMSAEYLTRHHALLRKASGKARSPAEEAEDRRFHFRCITPRTPTGLKESLVSAFAPLYEPLGYDKNDTRELLTNPANTIAYLQNEEGRIVSTAMAEHGTMRVRGTAPVRAVEITEASTHPDFRGQGLYRTVSAWLIRSLLAERRAGRMPIDVLYGESNLAIPGVVIAAAQNGRTFNTTDRRRFGIVSPAFGVLPQNFSIQGNENRRYNDFAVSYRPL